MSKVRSFAELCDLSEKKFAKISPEEREAFYKEWDAQAEDAKRFVSVQDYIGMDNVDLQIAIEQILRRKDNSFNNGKLSPMTHALVGKLFELRENAEIKGYVKHWISRTKYADLENEIASVHIQDEEYEDCGCCVRSGGHHTVTFKNGTMIVFSRDGVLLDKGGKTVTFGA